MARVPLADLADPANRFRVRHPPATSGRRSRSPTCWSGASPPGCSRRSSRRPAWPSRGTSATCARCRRPPCGPTGCRGRSTTSRRATPPRRRWPIPRPTGLRRVRFRPPMSGRTAARLGGGAAGALLGLVAAAGCGGGDAPGAGPPRPHPAVGTVTTAADGVQEITLQTQDDYVFVPDHFTVDPGTVRLTLVNVGRADDAQPRVPRPAAARRRSTGIRSWSPPARRRRSSSPSPSPATTPSSAPSTCSWGRSAR